MKILTAAQMRALDQATFHAVPSVAVMENAGRAVAEAIVSHYPEASKILVLAGKGNNGGDGYVIARALTTLGRSVLVLTVAETESLTGDALLHMNGWKVWGGATQRVSAEMIASGELDKIFMGHQLIVDALYGTGFRGEISGLEADCVRLANKLRAEDAISVVAVDIPSGVNADTGERGDVAIDANCTVAIQFLKWGHVLFPGTVSCGEVLLANVGIRSRETPDVRFDGELLTWDTISELLHKRSGLEPEAHKGLRGHVFVVGGAQGHFGAPVLAADGVLRGGAGLVTLFLPAAAANAIVPSRPEFMSLDRKELSPGMLRAESISECEEFITTRLHPRGAIVLGPGLEGGAQIVETILTVAAKQGVPTVLDAAALRACCGALAEKVGPNVVMTPHPGELSALLNCSSADIQRDRLGAARKAAKLFHCVVVLKGARTIVARPDGAVAVNPTNSRVLATAGSGDVLAGIVGAFLAQGLAPWDASRAAVFVHGLCGEYLEGVQKSEGQTARDLLEELPHAIKACHAFRSQPQTSFICRALDAVRDSGAAA